VPHAPIQRTVNRRAVAANPAPGQLDCITGRLVDYATIHGRYGKLEGVLSLGDAAASPTQGSA